MGGIASAVACGMGAMVMPSSAAVAEPAFPDMSAFSSVDSAAYERRAINSDSIEFSTPDGLNCSFIALGQMRDMTADQGLNCRGHFPGIDYDPPSNGWCEYKTVGNNHSFTYRFDRAYLQCGDHDFLHKPLPAGTRIASGNITCAVGPDRMTACLDTRAGLRHGFVLQPSGSSAF